MFDWTDEQKAAITGITQLFDSHNPQVAILTGAAGTGKTTACKELARALDPVLCAMTHKAAAVMSEKVGKDVDTLARVLKMRKFNNLDTGDTHFRIGMDVHLKKHTVFIDECSMMNKEMFDIVMKVLAPNYNVLFIGDKFQLPPVNEELSPVFQMDIPIFHLLEPVRFDPDSGIAAIANSVHQLIADNLSYAPKVVDIICNYNDVDWVSSEEAAPMMIEAFKQADDVDDVRMISFTNARVQAYNYHLKKAATGDADRIKPGDMLMANSSYSERIGGEDVLLLQNNQSVFVKEVEETEHRGLESYRVTTGLGRRMYVPASLRLYEAKSNELRAKAFDYPRGSVKRRSRFRSMFEFKDAFADLRLNYAQTVHKAQGSTYRTCFFDLTKLRPDKLFDQRLLYTGITRAAKKLVLFK